MENIQGSFMALCLRIRGYHPNNYGLLGLVVATLQVGAVKAARNFSTIVEFPDTLVIRTYSIDGTPMLDGNF